jgi:outer membrane protein assembly factor BamE
MKPFADRLLILIACLMFAGCVYRPPIQQGNILEESKITQLQTGMTRTTVRQLLGTPLATSPFTEDRWDYVYYHVKDKQTQLQSITIYFDGSQVSRVERGKNTPPVVKKQRWYWPF